MCSYIHNFFMTLFIVILINNTTLTAHRSPQKKSSLPVTQQNANTSKPVIIFDLINVLFKEHYAGFAQKIGYGLLTSYAITHWKNPGNRCLDMLDAIHKNNNQKPHITISLNDRNMPRCLVELQEGKKTCLQAKNEIEIAIEELDKEKFFCSTKEKKVMLSIMNLMLDPQALSQITEPIKPVLALAQKLKRNGHTLYLCANVPDEFYSVLQNKYPQILSLFDGVVISSKIKTVKPDNAMFQHLLTTHKLDPKQCIFIDNCKNNITMAESLGMRGIVYEKASTLTQYLKKQGVNLS